MFFIQTVPIQLAGERKNIADFVASFGLSYNGPIDYCVAAYNEHNELMATASLQQSIIRNIAVRPDYQGEGLVSILISNIISYAASKNIFYFLIFTKPTYIEQFKEIGFHLLATAPPYAALLEYGMNGFFYWLKQIQKSIPSGKPHAALIMNSNPFTIGHYYLAEYAAKRHSSVIIFIVEENKSLIPFVNRFNLAKKDLADLKNVIVLPSGPYIISNATFPAYFLKETEALSAETQLDATLFAKQIAPALHITDRYIGEEPFDITTRAYNNALKEILPKNNINLHLIPRKNINGSIISASKVRAAWKKQDWQVVKNYVSSNTLQYLQKNTQLIYK
ncbi:MAG: [citrate (pro-3S)-lyase] ligase [Megasphaera sp.]|uniref:[citrate (pro-3S)-lyase] ligase n=1 Tax=Megasphaera sueciensis TaxID=349094 RepID=UPI003D0691A8|nr:[citrate (pro-3S)-lyase] ligase [Megasphaera sp.]MCI1824054.1 [citrate (pro-3S)-lyase] ligase [Megasphaera sp.]